MARTKKPVSKAKARAAARKRRYNWVLYVPPEDRATVERLARYESHVQRRRVSPSEVVRVLARTEAERLDATGALRGF